MANEVRSLSDGATRALAHEVRTNPGSLATLRDKLRGFQGGHLYAKVIKDAIDIEGLAQSLSRAKDVHSAAPMKKLRREAVTKEFHIKLLLDRIDADFAVETTSNERLKKLSPAQKDERSRLSAALSDAHESQVIDLGRVKLWAQSLVYVQQTHDAPMIGAYRDFAEHREDIIKILSQPEIVQDPALEAELEPIRARLDELEKDPLANPKELFLGGASVFIPRKG